MEKNSKKQAGNVQKSVEEYVNSLSEEHKMLVVLKRQLYAGSWDDMLEDLSNRLEGKPYVFKLVNRINDDIDRISQLKDFEDRLDIDLADYISI